MVSAPKQILGFKSNRQQTYQHLCSSTEKAFDGDDGEFLMEMCTAMKLKSKVRPTDLAQRRHNRKFCS
eukprot:5094812-Pyramimonas_sp.AAC.4